MKQYRKLIIFHIDKTYKVQKVPKKSYEDSPNIESAGFAEAIKIKNQDDLNFKKKELNRLNYVEVYHL